MLIGDESPLRFARTKRTFTPLSSMLPVGWADRSTFEDKCLATRISLDNSMTVTLTRNEAEKLFDGIKVAADIILNAARQPNPLKDDQKRAPTLILRATMDGSRVEITSLGTAGTGPFL